jgi:hypothetical protein
MSLYHVSETPNIARFDPRADTLGNRVVWAVDEAHLPNYLLPRDCPRVCVRRGACQDAALAARLLDRDRHTIYVEDAWRGRIFEARLYVYEFEASQFACVDANAGYFQSTGTVRPLMVTETVDVEKAILLRGASLRFVDSLWSIQAMVVDSQLEFSCIRMRNAAVVGGSANI